MKIVLAPDSFKGSLDAQGVCSAFAAGIDAALARSELVETPMADGGEGTLDVLLQCRGGTRMRVATVDPLGRPLQAEIALLGDGETVVVESARASGLTLLRPEERNPMATSSYGSGLLVKAALQSGAKRMIIALGGSATSEGGLGLLQALGVRFRSSDHEELVAPITGADLHRIAAVDAQHIDSRLGECEIVAACDVDNVLLGAHGAVMTYGAQKGAAASELTVLEEGLQRVYAIIEREAGTPLREMRGSGAAGGMAAALRAFANARLVSGVDLILQAWQFDAAIQNADLILTGEGRLDGQTLSGKVIAGISRTARLQGIPVIAIVGAHPQACEGLYEMGLTAFFSILPGPAELEEAMRNAEGWIRLRCEQVMRLWSAARQCKQRA